MATVSEALRGRLVDFPAIAAIVGTRVYPALVPQGIVDPYLVFVRIDEDEEEAMGENADILETQFEVMSIAATYGDCEALYEEVRAACRRFRGTVNGVEVTDMLLRGGEGPLHSDDPPLYQATQRVAVRYRRP